MNYFDCTVIGDVFVDVIVHVDRYESRSFRGGTSYCSFAGPALGGGGNVAAGLSRIGGSSAFIGKAGRDLFGKLYLQDLKENEVTSELFTDENSPTGLTIVFVDSTMERSFLVFRGANDHLLSEDIEKAFSLVERSEYVYFSGFSLVNNPQRDTILNAIFKAKGLGKKIIFDPGAFNLVSSERKLFDSLLDICDVFSPNLEEARAITNASEIDDIVPRLRERVPLTLLKCDKNGSILFSQKETVKIRGSDSKCVDSTGAGDAFTAGALYGLSHRLSLESTGRLANWFSGEVVSRKGPRSFPEKSKIVDFLRGLEV